MNYHKIPDELLNEFEEKVYKFSKDYTEIELKAKNLFNSEEDLELLHHYTEGIYESIFEGNSAEISQQLNDIKNYSHITNELRESVSDLLERYTDIIHEVAKSEKSVTYHEFDLKETINNIKQKKLDSERLSLNEMKNIINHYKDNKNSLNEHSDKIIENKTKSITENER